MDTSGRTTINCCNPPNPLLTPLGIGEGCCPRRWLFTRAGRGCLASPQSCSFSTGLIKSRKLGLPWEIMGYVGIRCAAARTCTLTSWKLFQRELCAGRAFCWCALQGGVSADIGFLFPSVIHIETPTHIKNVGKGSSSFLLSVSNSKQRHF